MYHYYLGFKFMLSYFTIFPVKFKTEDDLSSSAVLSAMLFWLPFSGLLLGSLSLGLYLSLEKLGWFSALIASVTYPMFYGFLHTEAIMDVADALYARHSGKDAYAIIKEPTVGAMGVLWATAIFLLKSGGITFLFLHQHYTLLLAVLMLSRMGLLFLFFTQTFRSSFLMALKKGFGSKAFAGSLLLFSLTGFALTGLSFLLLSLVALLLSYFIATSLAKQLGFMNGDVLGTTLEVTETLLLILGASLWL